MKEVGESMRRQLGEELISLEAKVLEDFREGVNGQLNKELWRRMVAMRRGEEQARRERRQETKKSADEMNK